MRTVRPGTDQKTTRDPAASTPRSARTRRAALAIGMLAGVVGLYAPQPGRSLPGAPPFQSWLAALVDEAIDRGFERRLVEQTLSGLRPLPHVVTSDRAQAQTPPALDDYLSQRVTPDLVAQGREMMRTHAPPLGLIENVFGVPPAVLVAIWGAETGYGRYTGDVPVFQALATLAWEPRRAPYFRRELFDALQVVAAGHIDGPAMVGSWAGAMGQPQFMPSSYLKYAVDFDEDGRRDIWGSVPDTIGSIANYLREYGWRPGEAWGREVAIDDAHGPRRQPGEPTRQRGCAAVRTLTERRPTGDWASRGIREVNGASLLPGAGSASLLTIDSRSFLVLPNYEVILGYNCSHRYALSVVLLADAIR